MKFNVSHAIVWKLKTYCTMLIIYPGPDLYCFWSCTCVSHQAFSMCAIISFTYTIIILLWLKIAAIDLLAINFYDVKVIVMK